jgi:hypothetical protein
VRIVEAFVEQLDLREMGFEDTDSSCDWPAGVSHLDHVENLRLRISEPHSINAAASNMRRSVMLS